MGSAAGVEKVAAKRLGLSLEDYRANIAAGLKHCGKCRQWLARSAFNADATRGDGLDKHCQSCRSTGNPKGWHDKPNINPETGRPGPTPQAPRDGDKFQARQAVTRLVRLGLVPKAAALACADCGHIGADRKHEYDHHLGYAAEHHEHVEPVCVDCHSRRTHNRGESVHHRDAKGKFTNG